MVQNLILGSFKVLFRKPIVGLSHRQCLVMHGTGRTCSVLIDLLTLSVNAYNINNDTVYSED